MEILLDSKKPLKLFHKHKWRFEKLADEIPDIKSGMYQTYYENPETKEQASFPIVGYVVRERKIQSVAIYRCEKCKEITRYCGFGGP